MAGKTTITLKTNLLFGPAPEGETHMSFASLETPEESPEGMYGARQYPPLAPEDDFARPLPDHHRRPHARVTDHHHRPHAHETAPLAPARPQPWADGHHHRPFDLTTGHHHRPHVKEAADAFLSPHDRRLTDTPREKEAAAAHEGTSRSFRNRNPGNIKYGQVAKDFGAVGKDEKGFAIFPSNAAGERAQRALWNTGGYSDLTIGNALSRWSAGGYRSLPGIDSSKKWERS
jgi:hypothetical protein